MPVETSQQYLMNARSYLNSRHGFIEPRKRRGDMRKIANELLMQRGWCLYADYYSAGGQSVRDGKYRMEYFSPELVQKSAHALSRVVPANGIDLVVPVPSRRRPRLVADFARSLAEALGIGFCEAVAKTSDVPEQKTLLNSVQQERSIEGSTCVMDPESVRGNIILLVDDMVDSRWTLTVVAEKLLAAGACKVYPFALVKTGGG